MNTPLTDAIERHFKEKGEWDIQSLLSNSRSLEVALDLATTQLAKTKEELSRRPTHEAAERKQKLLEKARFPVLAMDKLRYPLRCYPQHRCRHILVDLTVLVHQGLN